MLPTPCCTPDETPFPPTMFVDSLNGVGSEGSGVEGELFFTTLEDRRISPTGEEPPVSVGVTTPAFAPCGTDVFALSRFDEILDQPAFAKDRSTLTRTS